MNKAAFFAAIPPLRREKVELPNGDVVYVRQMTVGERDRFEQTLERRGKAGVRACLAIASVVEEDGTPVFCDDDFERLAAAPVVYLESVFEAIQRLNAITDTDVAGLAGESEASR